MQTHVQSLMANTFKERTIFKKTSRFVVRRRIENRALLKMTFRSYMLNIQILILPIVFVYYMYIHKKLSKLACLRSQPVRLSK